jgi:hypothetical protein
VTPPHRRVVLQDPRRRRRRSRGGLIAVVAAAVAAGAVAAVLATTGGFARDADPPPRPAEGTANREIYSRVHAGASRASVIALAGSPPVRSRRIVRDGIRLDCIVYDRRSGRPGRYRFCFRGGYLWTKSAPSLGLSPGGR